MKPGSGSQICTQNQIVTDIQQRIPIPRPLTKINGQIVGRFIGSNANQQDVGGSPSTSNSSSFDPPQSMMVIGGAVITATIIQSGGPGLVSIVTRVSTATVQADTQPHQPTSLDESTFGGPGGDLTDVLNDNVSGPKRSSSSDAHQIKGLTHLHVMTLLFVCLVIVIL